MSPQTALSYAGLCLALVVAIVALSRIYAAIQQRRRERATLKAHNGSLQSSVDRYVDPEAAARREALRRIAVLSRFESPEPKRRRDSAEMRIEVRR